MEEKSKSTVKIHQIIDAAQSLFGIHGFEKVSMNEIADDLRMSKASLYYYFPDKESLCKAVLEKEKREFLQNISTMIEKIPEPDRMLKEYSVMRLNYFRRFLNLSRIRQETYSALRPVFREVLKMFRSKEEEIIQSILQKGIREKMFYMEEVEETASLYLDLLKGLSVSVINLKKTMIIDQEEYDLLMRRTALFTGVFIKGLKTE
jgi:AcrR family transcriptional regulator